MSAIDSRPLVSVCLPVYNGQKYLSAAIQSVLAQSYSNFELIVIDDLSNDDSWQIIERYAQQDSRVKAQRNEVRLGLFANYNVCLSQANGEILKPFAQDDLLYAVALEHMVSPLINDPTIALVCAYREFIDSNGDHLEKSRDLLSPGKHNSADVINLVFRTFHNIIGEPVCVAFRRQHKGSGFDSAYYSLGDLDYWLRILRDGDLYKCSQTLMAFRRHNESTTKQLVSDLTYTLDYFRLGKEHESSVIGSGSTLQDWYGKAMLEVGGFLNHLIDCNDLDVSQLDGFKEVAFHALQKLGQVKNAQESGDTFTSSLTLNLSAELEALKRRRELLEREHQELMDNYIYLRGSHSALEEKCAGLESKCNVLEGKCDVLESKCEVLETNQDQLLNSLSWSITKPLRAVRSAIRKQTQSTGTG